jgi:hypothetical protein
MFAPSSEVERRTLDLVQATNCSDRARFRPCCASADMYVKTQRQCLAGSAVLLCCLAVFAESVQLIPLSYQTDDYLVGFWTCGPSSADCTSSAPCCCCCQECCCCSLLLVAYIGWCCPLALLLSARSTMLHLGLARPRSHSGWLWTQGVPTCGCRQVAAAARHARSVHNTTLMPPEQAR